MTDPANTTSGPVVLNGAGPAGPMPSPQDFDTCLAVLRFVSVLQRAAAQPPGPIHAQSTPVGTAAEQVQKIARLLVPATTND